MSEPPSSPPTLAPLAPDTGGAIALLAYLGLGAPFVLFCLVSWLRAFWNKYGSGGQRASRDLLTVSTKKLFASAKPARPSRTTGGMGPDGDSGAWLCCSALCFCCWIGVGVLIWFLMLEFITGQLDPELGLSKNPRGVASYTLLGVHLGVISAALYVCVFLLGGICCSCRWAQSMRFIDLYSVRRNQGAAPFKHIASIQNIAPECVFTAIYWHEVWAQNHTVQMGPNTHEGPKSSWSWQQCGTHVERHVIKDWEDASPGLPDAWKGAGLLSVELDVELTFGSEGAKAAYMKARSDFGVHRPVQPCVTRSTPKLHAHSPRPPSSEATKVCLFLLDRLGREYAPSAALGHHQWQYERHEGRPNG